VLAILSFGPSFAQEISFADSFKVYEQHRMVANAAGAEVICGWGLANLAGSAAGYFTAKQDEWKYFHLGNAAFGLANTAVGYSRVLVLRWQAVTPAGGKIAYSRYKAEKKRHLMGLGTDVVFMAGGIALSRFTGTGNDAAYHGLGKSMVLQGAFLAVYDNIMLISHARYEDHWLRLLDELRFTGTGLTYVHTF